MGFRRGAATGAASGAKARRGLRLRFGSFRFYIVLTLVVIVLHEVDSVLYHMQLVEPQDPQLVAEFQKKQLDIWAEMNKLLIALATVTIGALGGFMLNREGHKRLQPRSLHRAAASWLFCALSLYLGYLSYQQATLMLSQGVFNPISPRVYWPARAQFWTYLISIVLFADFIYGSIRDQEEPMGEET